MAPPQPSSPPSAPVPVLPRRSTGTLPPPYDSQEDIQLQSISNSSSSAHILAIPRSHSDGYLPAYPMIANIASGSSQEESYPRHDPFTEALRHTESLQGLCARCKDSDRQRVFRLGELVGGLTQLLRKARELDALDVEEEQEQLRELIINAEKANTSRDSTSTASAQRRLVWIRAASLLVDIQNRLCDGHVAASLKAARQAAVEAREERRRRNERVITQ